MKVTLLFATLSMVFAAPRTFATTELEALRDRCARQEQEIRRLEEQVHKTQPESAKHTSEAKPAAVAGAGSYTVRSGDSLERIARRNGCSATALIKANGLRNSAVIHPGQKLKIPGKTVVAQTTALASRPASVAPSKPSGATHKVAEGETFASISRKHRIALPALLAANPDVKPTALRPGQIVRLGTEAPAVKSAPVIASQAPAPRPSKPAAAPVLSASHSSPRTMPISTRETTLAPAPAPAPTVAESTPAPAPAPAPAPQPATAASGAPQADAQQGTNPSPNPEKKIRSVTIEGEMSYGEFAAKHGTDTERLNDLNGLDLTHATVLAKGSELYVPAQP